MKYGESINFYRRLSDSALQYEKEHYQKIKRLARNSAPTQAVCDRVLNRIQKVIDERKHFK